MAISSVRSVAVARPTAAVARPTAAAPAAPVAPVKAQAKPVVAPQTEWNVGRVLKAGAVGAGGFVGGGAATVVADLFFHFGNNGGTAWPGGIYLMAAGACALGAIALYSKLSAK